MRQVVVPLIVRRTNIAFERQRSSPGCVLYQRHVDFAKDFINLSGAVYGWGSPTGTGQKTLLRQIVSFELAVVGAMLKTESDANAILCPRRVHTIFTQIARYRSIEDFFSQRTFAGPWGLQIVEHSLRYARWIEDVVRDASWIAVSANDLSSPVPNRLKGGRDTWCYEIVLLL